MPFFGDSRRPGSGRKWLQNEASSSSIRDRKDGRLYCWRVGRDPPMIFRKMRTDRWGLMAPYVWTLIPARNASFFGDFRRCGIGVEMVPKMRHPYLRIGAIKRASQIGVGLVGISQDLPDITGRSLGINGALIPECNRSYECHILWRFYAGRGRGGNGSKNEESLSSIRADEEGRPVRRGVGRESPSISRQVRTGHWD